MKHRIAVTLGIVVAGLALGGCGVKQDDMRQRAVRSAADEDEISPEVAAALGLVSASRPETPSAEPSLSSTVDPTTSSSPADIDPSVQQTAKTITSSDPDKSASPDAAQSGAAETVRKRPLTDEERRQLTVDRLQRIAGALEDYRTRQGRYPAGTIMRGRTSMLSWRVELLPYLGYQELFQQFRLDEPWDGPSNRKLLQEIPDVYQSPERADENTNYLAVFGGRAAFDQRDPRWPRDFRDGLEHTALVVEVDDVAAVPWTAPQEYEYRVRQPRLNLGTLREDGFLLIWGGGLVGLIPHDAPAEKVAGMYTIDGDEILRYHEIHQDPRADARRAAAEDRAPNPGHAKTVAAGKAASGARIEASELLPRKEVRTAPPTSEQYETALATWRDLLESRYKAANNSADRRELAKEMLGRVEQTDDAVARYVLLTLVSQIAAESGDIAMALTAVEKLAEQYDVQELLLRADALRTSSRGESTNGSTLVNEAVRCACDAFRIDDYSVATEMSSVAVAAARRENGAASRQLLQLKRSVEAGERSFREVARSMKRLETDPENGVSNAVVGRYYCFLKNQWDRGLPFLGRSDDAEVARIATADAASPVSPEERVALADDWWNLGERLGDTDRRACHQRAVHWYQSVLDQGRTGMPAVKADIRIREAERLYGRNE